MQRPAHIRLVPALIAIGVIALVAGCATTPPPPVNFTLTVLTSGTGGGTVTSFPGGIDTAAAAGDQADFEEGTIVRLTAAAGAFSTFGGWSGACAGAVGLTCDVDMDAAKSAGATFTLLPGTLYFSQDDNANGLFAIDLDTGVATLVGSGITTVSGSTVGLAGRGANEPLVGSLPFGLAEIEQDGSGVTEFSTLVAEGLTYVAGSDLVYAIINSSFDSVSPTTGLVVEDLTDPVDDLEGLAADEASGLIYAIGADTNLWAYDIASDAWSVVFDTGIDWNLGGLAYSDAEEVLYAIGAGSDEDGVYRIDPIAQTVDLVGNTGLADKREGGLAWVPGN